MSELPAWAVVKPKRLEHITRVARLIGDWADQAGLDAHEKQRWVRAAWLHDALRDEKPEILRPQVAGAFADWSGPLLHGPAAAARLRGEGFDDEGLLLAVSYHTVGHPDLDAAGRALYLADYLEPGRPFDPVGRSVLRTRMPHDMRGVLRDVLRARIGHMMDGNKMIRRETIAFWNGLS
jgi:2-amino-4-hydroxy-6-hydroxymethyldihydropteridine diphosphokinase